MTLCETLDNVIATRRPDVVMINRKMFKILLLELSQIDGSFKNVRIKYKNVAIHSNPEIPDGEIKSSKNPKIKI